MILFYTIFPLLRDLLTSKPNVNIETTYYKAVPIRLWILNNFKDGFT